MEQEGNPTRKRVFLNDVDGYSSKHIAKVLATCKAEEESEDDENESIFSSPEAPTVYHVIGSVSSSSQDEELQFLHEQLESPSREELFRCLLTCNVVVYNVSESSTLQQVEEATWAISALHAEMENFESKKMFILISTVMTWARTQPQNTDEPGVFSSEEDFRKRRTHLNFKPQSQLEKLVLKLCRKRKSKLRGYVVAAGFQYGMEENLFHYFFKVSWLMQTPKVPIFGPGTNHLPLVHVYDLGGIIHNIIKERPKSKYILAVDDSKSTVEEIVTKISEVVGPAKVHKLPLQEAIIMNAFKPQELDCLGVDIRLDAETINDVFILDWTCQAGMVENMETIVQEYKNTRQLLPVKICLIGPPAVGKTTLAKKLCEHYKIHRVSAEGLAEEKIQQLNESISEAEAEPASEEAAAAAKVKLEELNESLDNNQGRLPEEEILVILQGKLNSMPCRNQGFVLDGFPETYEQAKVLFYEEEPEREDSFSTVPWYKKTIAPEHVFFLEASNEFLRKRVRELPQRVAAEQRYTRNEFLARLKRYRELSSTNETIFDFFDHREIHPKQIGVTADDFDYADALKQIIESVGVPKNYGPSPEEQEEENRRKEAELRQKLAAEAAERKSRREAALAEMVSQCEEWEKSLSEVKRQEEERLEAASLPLVNYLMKYMMPSLTEAMLDCSKIKPEDPVDFVVLTAQA